MQLMNMIDEGVVYANRCCPHMILARQITLMFFADVVRRVATIIRDDYTYDDRVNLIDMPKISLRSKGLSYGVDPQKSFWL